MELNIQRNSGLELKTISHRPLNLLFFYTRRKVTE